MDERRPGLRPSPLDPFGEAPLTRPRPVPATSLVAAVVAGALLLFGMGGVVVAGITGEMSQSVAGYVPLFVGPFNTSLLPNAAHLSVGLWGVLASRRPAWARAFLLAAGSGYAGLCLAETLVEVVRGSGTSAVVVTMSTGASSHAVDVPTLAPTLHLVFSVLMVATGWRRHGG